MSHVFISYSRKNSECVYSVVEEMKKSDFPVWVDLESISITNVWLEKIEQAITEARVFMLFWSAEAQESDYVTHELHIAKKLSIESKIEVLVVMLDNTPFPLDYIQAYNMKSGCSPITVKNLVNSLPKDWKQFSRSKMLGKQSHTVVDGEFVSVFFDRNAYCKAYIVGKQNSKLPDKPEHLAVALQFYRPTNSDMLGSVISSLPSGDNWILHITGPVVKDNYELDNNKPSQWESCRKFIVENIQKVGNQSTTTVHFYTLTPNALLGGVTMPLYRFWHVKLYNFVASKYVPLIELSRT